MDQAHALGRDLFRPDWAQSLESQRRVLQALLAIILIALFFALRGSEVESGLVVFFAGFIALYAAAGEVTLRRMSANRPLLAVGPEGVAFPANDIGIIAWEDLARVSVVRTRTRHFRTSGLRFHFRRPLATRQFGSLSKHRFEIQATMGAPFIGDSARIEGGLDAMIASIERFHPVEK